MFTVISIALLISNNTLIPIRVGNSESLVDLELADAIIANLILHPQGINLIPVTISKSNLRVQSVQWIINREFCTPLRRHIDPLEAFELVISALYDFTRLYALLSNLKDCSAKCQSKSY